MGLNAKCNLPGYIYTWWVRHVYFGFSFSEWSKRSILRPIELALPDSEYGGIRCVTLRGISTERQGMIVGSCNTDYGIIIYQYQSRLPIVQLRYPPIMPQGSSYFLNIHTP